jgi:pyruvate-ferredoxin/flavodoxin oxidoreductase
MLWHTHPEVAEELAAKEQKNVNHRYNFYRQLAQLDWNDSEQLAENKARARTIVSDSKEEG